MQRKQMLLLAGLLLLMGMPVAAQGYWYYYWGQLNVHADGAQAYTAASVPYGCVNRSGLELTRESETVDHRTGGNCCWGCGGGTVFLWVEHQGCLPPQTWYAAAGEAEFVLPDYGWAADTYWDGRATPPSQVAVTSASIPSDQITVELTPCGGYGELVVTVTGDTTVELYRGSSGGGVQVVSFNIPALPDGKTFQQVRAEWTPQDGARTGTRNYAFKVLGDYLHTQYNIPRETECSGNPIPFSYIDRPTCLKIGDCASAPLGSSQGRSNWISETRENGTGLHSSLGYIWKEQQSECRARAEFRRVDAPCPACGGVLTAGESVARNPRNSDLPCGAAVYVHGLGVKTVQDSGGGGMGWLDHFAGESGCNEPSSLGVRKTIRLFGQ